MAHASDTYVCSVAVATGAASNTTAPSAGTCTWGVGATISVQCDQPVWYRVRGAIVRNSPSVVGNTPVASAVDVLLAFTLNADPYPITLGKDEQVVSLLATTGAGTCRFFQRSNQDKTWFR